MDMNTAGVHILEDAIHGGISEEVVQLLGNLELLRGDLKNHTNPSIQDIEVLVSDNESNFEIFLELQENAVGTARTQLGTGPDKNYFSALMNMSEVISKASLQIGHFHLVQLEHDRRWK